MCLIPGLHCGLVAQIPWLVNSLVEGRVIYTFATRNPHDGGCTRKRNLRFLWSEAGPLLSSLPAHCVEESPAGGGMYPFGGYGARVDSNSSVYQDEES